MAGQLERQREMQAAADAAAAQERMSGGGGQLDGTQTPPVQNLGPTEPYQPQQQLLPQAGPMPQRPGMDPMNMLAMGLGMANPERFGGIGQMAQMAHQMQQQEYADTLAARNARFEEEYKREQLKLQRQQALGEIGSMYQRDAMRNPNVAAMSEIEYYERAKQAERSQTSVNVGTGQTIADFKLEKALARNDEFVNGPGIDYVNQYINDMNNLYDLSTSGTFNPTGFKTRLNTEILATSPKSSLLISQINDPDSQTGEAIVTRMKIGGTLKTLGEQSFGALSEGEREFVASSENAKWRTDDTVRQNIIADAQSKIRMLKNQIKNADLIDEPELAETLQQQIDAIEGGIEKWKTWRKGEAKPGTSGDTPAPPTTPNDGGYGSTGAATSAPTSSGEYFPEDTATDPRDAELERRYGKGGLTDGDVTTFGGSALDEQSGSYSYGDNLNGNY